MSSRLAKLIELVDVAREFPVVGRRRTFKKHTY